MDTPANGQDSPGAEALRQVLRDGYVNAGGDELLVELVEELVMLGVRLGVEWSAVSAREQLGVDVRIIWPDGEETWSMPTVEWRSDRGGGDT